MYRKSVHNNSTSTGNMPATGIILGGVYESIVNVSEINITVSGVQTNGTSGIKLKYEYSNDGINFAISTEVNITTNYYSLKLAKSSYTMFRIVATVNVGNSVNYLNISTVFKNSLYIDSPKKVIVDSGLISIKDTLGNALMSVDGALTVGITGTVPVSGTFYQEYQGVTGHVNIDNFPDLQGVTGHVNIDNFPDLQGVTGHVNIDNFPDLQGVTGHVNIDNFPDWQGVSGTVAISNFPDLQGVTGHVNIDNFPDLQGVTGTVGITGTVQVSGAFYQTYQGVTGQVAISNLPAVQGVTGSVSISNFSELNGVFSGTTTVTFPALQGVTGTVGITGTVPVSGAFYPTYQGVTGQVAISNLPIYQGVSGTVAISNYPSTQSTKIVPTSDIPFVSRSLGNTGLVVAGLSKVLRNLSLAKSDDILTYVYIYDKATAATSGDTPIFLFIIKNFVGIQLTLNHLFLLGISIRATSDLNGTTSPTADTVFANITFSTP